MQDITERRRAEEKLVWRATHDALTQLPNRTLIRERLMTALQRSHRQHTNVALLFIDLDGFKAVNDVHGHEAGDDLLRNVAARLLELMRAGDTLARLAGDEFVVLCEQLEQPSTISALAERINTALREPFIYKDSRLFVTASIGIAIGHGSTHTADDLLRSSDTAMYAVKAKGRDGWQFFNTSLQAQAQRRLSISHGLHFAIERQELSCRFQPIVCLNDGHVAGAELLLRWHPPEGEVSPGIFIPIAEMSGLISGIGNWVFREGCVAEAEWRRRWGNRAPAYISINVSARQLGDDKLAEVFSAILVETGADPARIMIEITETALMADVEMNLRMLRKLTDLGLRIVVDDFGTGYSSLAHLTRMPVSVLKIDKAFVDGIERQQECRTVTNAIISLGKSLNLRLVAEGVETQGQMKELCERGCDFAQGYLFYRPLDQKTFIEAMERQLLHPPVPSHKRRKASLHPWSPRRAYARKLVAPSSPITQFRPARLAA